MNNSGIEVWTARKSQFAHPFTLSIAVLSHKSVTNKCE